MSTALSLTLTTILVVAVGLMFAGFIALAISTDGKADTYAGGRRGLILDTLMVRAPVLLIPVAFLGRPLIEPLGPETLWLWVLGSVLVLNLAWLLSPPVRSARTRLKAAAGVRS